MWNAFKLLRSVHTINYPVTKVTVRKIVATTATNILFT